MPEILQKRAVLDNLDSLTTIPSGIKTSEAISDADELADMREGARPVAKDFEKALENKQGIKDTYDFGKNIPENNNCSLV